MPWACCAAAIADLASLKKSNVQTLVGQCMLSTLRIVAFSQIGVNVAMIMDVLTREGCQPVVRRNVSLLV